MAPPMPLPTPQPILMQQQMQQQPPPSTPSILSPSFTNLPPTPAPPLTLPMPTMGGGIPPALQESQDSLKRKRDEESVAPPKPKPIVGLDSRRGDDRRAKKNASARARQKVKKERTERLLEQKKSNIALNAEDEAFMKNINDKKNKKNIRARALGKEQKEIIDSLKLKQKNDSLVEEKDKAAMEAYKAKMLRKNKNDLKRRSKKNKKLEDEEDPSVFSLGEPQPAVLAEAEAEGEIIANPTLPPAAQSPDLVGALEHIQRVAQAAAQQQAQSQPQQQLLIQPPPALYQYMLPIPQTTLPPPPMAPMAYSNNNNNNQDPSAKIV